MLKNLPLVKTWVCTGCGTRHYHPVFSPQWECSECGELNWQKAELKGFIPRLDGIGL